MKCCMDIFGRSAITIRRILRSRSRGPAVRRTRLPSAAVVRRRGLLARAATVTVRVQHRVFPKYTSSRALRSYLHSEGISVNERTVRRDLHCLGFKCLVRRPAPTRTEEDAKRRLAFARVWSRKDAKKLVFSDECWVTCLENTSRTMWVDRRCDPHAQPLPLERKSRFNVPSVQVWAAFGFNYRSELVILPRTTETGSDQSRWTLNGAGYIRRCLSKITPYLLSSKRILLQDGSRAHANKSVWGYAARKGLKLLEDFPANSPDYNMIEMVWGLLKKGIGRRCPLTMPDLIASAKAAWNEIPQTVLNNYVIHFGKLMKREAKQ